MTSYWRRLGLALVTVGMTQVGASAASQYAPPSQAPAPLVRPALPPQAPAYIRDRIDQHWQCDECGRTPLADLRPVIPTAAPAAAIAAAPGITPIVAPAVIAAGRPLRLSADDRRLRTRQ